MKYEICSQILNKLKYYHPSEAFLTRQLFLLNISPFYVQSQYECSICYRTFYSAFKEIANLDSYAVNNKINLFLLSIFFRVLRNSLRVPMTLHTYVLRNSCVRSYFYDTMNIVKVSFWGMDITRTQVSTCIRYTVTYEKRLNRHIYGLCTYLIRYVVSKEKIMIRRGLINKISFTVLKAYNWKIQMKSVTVWSLVSNHVRRVLLRPTYFFVKKLKTKIRATDLQSFSLLRNSFA
jgi:hypothetical protein